MIDFSIELNFQFLKYTIRKCILIFESTRSELPIHITYTN